MNRLLYFIKNPRYVLVALLEKYGGWISDQIYIRIAYYLHTGRRLHLNPPITFCEKMQWLKLNDRNPLYARLVDKYEVKDYVSNIIGSKYIIKTLGVWDKVEEIDYNQLPQRFVLKTTHDGGGGGVILCDKDNLDVSFIQRKMRASQKHNIYKTLREYPYKNIRPRIMAEEFIQQTEGTKKGMTDYKFYCFNGEPKFCQVKTHDDREDCIDIFDLQWNLLPFTALNPKHKHARITPQKPPNFDEMVILAEKLCLFAVFVRVDFYNVQGRVLFGEITFYPASGMGSFCPSKFDKIYGKELVIWK